MSIDALVRVSSIAAVAVLSLNSSFGGPIGIAPGRLLIKEKDGAPDFALVDALRPFSGKVTDEIAGIRVKVVRVPERALPMALAGLAHNPHIEFAEPDALVEPSATPNDPSFSTQWHLAKIQTPSAWDVTFGSANVTIAILDTGVDSSHPDLAGNIVPGWNFYDGNADTSDVYGHGTAVAGTAAAAVNNILGVAGVAGGCKIMPIRISDAQGSGFVSDMARGLTWAADRGARAANISYRVTTSSTINSAAEYFQRNGGVVAISAGNQADFDPSQDNPYILTVGATDSSDRLASFSTTGNLVDLVAPGVGVLTTTRGGGYGGVSGTSFSAPIVAGVAALVISANPTLSGKQAYDIVKNSTDDLGTAGYDTTFGAGRVNAARAVALALATDGSNTSIQPAPEPISVPQPDTESPVIAITSPVSGATVASTGAFNITVNATDNVGVVKVQLYVDGKLTATSSSAPFATKWNTKKASAGAHTLQVKAYDAAGNAALSPIVTVNRK